MLVRNFMTTEVRTVMPETSSAEALRTAREYKVRRLPVLNKQRHVVGIVAEKDLNNAAEARSMTLRPFARATGSGIKVGEIMTRGVIMVGPQVSLEEAARLMADNKIGGLPVVDEQQRLVGIITETDIFRVMVELLGARRSGLRLTFQVEDQVGALAQLVGEITRQGATIITLNVFRGDNQERPTIVTKVEGGDEARLVAMLRGRRATIIDVRRA